jgi:D-3-phosphoglycerate dehydrogenase
VLFTEPEAYDDALRAELPSNWQCAFQSFSDEKELSEWVSAQQHDIVFSRIGLSFGASFFQASRETKILATPTTGLDHIDMNAADAAGVRVMSLRGELELLHRITSTAEHAWGLLLACNRRIPRLVERARSGSWARGDLELQQLSGQTIGIIGMGRLGRMVADYACAFRMPVLAYDPYVQEDQFPDGVERVPLENLLAESAHVMLTATYSPGDPVILGREHVLAIKPGATFVNVARGELTDEATLVEAIDLGILRSVGVDVLPGDARWTGEKQVTSPLIEKSRQSDSVLVTPHVGGYAREAVNETRRFLVQRVAQVIENE